ncbi:MAG: 3'-5' exonuclease, partial [Atribacterota bacterium]|nr:3'-5' exonuclease [Atribacterota bacterium]
ILKDDSNTRSFFYVGDVKQTIYRWRGGNPDLFNSVLNRYGKKITNELLNKAHRTAQPIIDTVNRVFSRLPEMQGETSEPAISRRGLLKWNSAWKEHECGEQAPNNGYAAILQPTLPEGAKYHEPENQLELLARLLKHISPTEREQSTAILVRTNATGKKIADYLRQYGHEHDWHDLNISYEGETALLDNPLIAVLLDLLRYAEHPADNFAKQHLIMSPLGIWMDKNKTSVESLPLILLGQIAAQGFRPAVCEWAAKLGALDDFGRLRLQQMLEIAGQFDNRFDRNISLFIKTVESYGTREASEAKGCIHIMTIHQSKGLGFDMVILPDLNDNKKMNSAGAIDFLTGHSDGSNVPAWL